MNKNTTGWLSFRYNDEVRNGLVIGPDTRPGTNNVVCCTADGIRTFKVEKMQDVIDETVLYA